MNILCTICMRGGSKGVPNKNLRDLNGKPLMAYTIEQALDSRLFKSVVVSTDSENIAETAKDFGAATWFLRPPELATDDAPKLPVIRHAHMEAENYFGQIFDVLVDLDATSPLRYVEDILNAYNQFLNENSDVIVSACPSRKNPYFNMVELINGKVRIVKPAKKEITRRQDSPIVFDMNASIYIWKRKALLGYNTLFTNKTSLYVMPEERSVDIDTELDWDFVEFLVKKYSK